MSSINRLIIFCLLVFSGEIFPMSFIAGEESEVVLFSPMSGYITLNGVPVKDVVLERKVKWSGDKEFKDAITTDENGRFAFGVLKDHVKTSPLSQFVVNQSIYATHENKNFKVWVRGNLDGKEVSELGGKPINFRCELTDPFVRIEVDNGQLGTLCQWDNIE